MKELQVVLDNYLDLKATNKSSTKPTRPEQIAIKYDIPQFFTSILEKENKHDRFKIEGSYGQGNLANIPWVAIFDKEITTSAQSGYYIVLLFSADMQSCYLSLNQGVTSYLSAYGNTIGFQKIQNVSEQASNYLAPSSETTRSLINLQADRPLGKGYELGNIEAFCYQKDNLPTRAQFEQHVKILLKHYRQLFKNVGHNLQSLLTENEEDYQLMSLQLAVSQAKQKKLPLAKEPTLSYCKNTKYGRDPYVTAYAINEANFQCEIDPTHNTFISESNGYPYVEGHHLVPMAQQKKFKSFSLDIYPNVVALCPNCHRLVHHGKWEDKKEFLENLFQRRQFLLKEWNISVTWEDLQKYYGHNPSINIKIKK